MEYLGKHFSVAAVVMKVIVNVHKSPHNRTERCKEVLLCGIYNFSSTVAANFTRTSEAYCRRLRPLMKLCQTRPPMGQNITSAYSAARFVYLACLEIMKRLTFPRRET